MLPAGNRFLGFIIIIILITSATLYGRLRYIPDDYTNIQTAINDSGGGDTLIVRPGTYYENINFNGQNLVLASEMLLTGDYNYIETTILDGDSSDAVLTFANGEGPSSLVYGFTIQHGKSHDGAGVFCDGASPIIAYNIIRNNYAYRPTGGGNGGGVYCSYSNAIIMNNLIAHNQCSGVYGGFGAGIASRNAVPIIINNTITRNLSNQLGGGLFSTYSNPVVTNCIFWNNEAVDEGNELYIHESDFSITYSDIFAGYAGQGNINSNPEFRDPANDDFRLMSTEYGYSYDSPCIDTGNPLFKDHILSELWGLGTVTSDMGAFGGGDSTGTDIFGEIRSIPDKIALNQNYPNPFNPVTKIDFNLNEPQHVILKVFNLLGQEIESLIDNTLEAGSHSVTFDASKLSSGVYYYTLKTNDRVESRSMVLMK